MSEQQNVTVIQKLLEAFGRGDVPTILDHCTNDCEFYCPGPSSIPYAGTKKGRAEIQNYFDALTGTQSNANLSIDQYVSDDERDDDPDKFIIHARSDARSTLCGFSQHHLASNVWVFTPQVARSSYRGFRM